MRVDAFRAWLAAQGQIASSVSTRVSDARRVETHYGDLDAAFERDGFEEVLAALAYTSADRAASRPNPSRLPISGDLYDSLASYRGAINAYRRFAGESDEQLPQADRIRQFVRDTLILPARERGEHEVEVIAGDVHRAMQLDNAMPAVCSALGGDKFEKLAGVKLVDRQGPANSSTVRFRYALGAPLVQRSEKTHMPTNLILYGPPGTGKTFATAREAVCLCDGQAPETEDEVRQRYAELAATGQVRFVTFHQSYSYEDFVEGLRPTTGEEDGDKSSGGFRLAPVPGVFREIATVAEQAMRVRGGGGAPFDVAGRKVFKMSLGRAGSEDYIFDGAIEGGYVVLGWGGDIDWTPYETYEAIHAKWNELHPGTNGNDANIVQTSRFRADMREGDLIVVSYGNSRFRAIGEVTGPYEFAPINEQDYNHRRAVKWLFVPDEPLPISFYDRPFTMRSCYLLREEFLNRDALALLLPGSGDGKGTPPAQFVLICDEINRANISKVFGELITLIEPDKRIGGKYELRLTLPYSKHAFGVPSNLHIIGTMNTADRSIALLDTALRRRFTFKEVMPSPTLLGRVESLDLAVLLTKLNDRIEYLFDREHQIGHAYLMGCDSREALDEVIRHKIIPLLAEYFHEDWGKIAAVLGDPNGTRFLQREVLPAPSGFESEFGGDRYRWRVREAFGPDAYAGLQ